MCDELYEAKKSDASNLHTMLIQPCHVLLYESEREREREKKTEKKAFEVLSIQKHLYTVIRYSIVQGLHFISFKVNTIQKKNLLIIN